MCTQVMEHVGRDVFETFDVICGTRYVPYHSTMCLTHNTFSLMPSPSMRGLHAS